MKAIEKDLRVTLIFAILLSFALVGGIPAIIFGASYGITPLLVIGIICTVAGFYGTPMMWVAYSGKSDLRRWFSPSRRSICILWTISPHSLHSNRTTSGASWTSVFRSGI